MMIILDLLPQSELLVFWQKYFAIDLSFWKPHDVFCHAYRRHDKMYPRIMIPNYLCHFYQMAVHFILIHLGSSYTHILAHTCSNGLTKTIKNIGLTSFLLSCNLFPLPFSFFLIKLVLHRMKSQLSFRKSIYCIWAILFNKQQFLNGLWIMRHEVKNRITEDPKNIWIGAFM